jgi:hypothetical protein
MPSPMSLKLLFDGAKEHGFDRELPRQRQDILEGYACRRPFFMNEGTALPIDSLRLFAGVMATLNPQGLECIC